MLAQGASYEIPRAMPRVSQNSRTPNTSRLHHLGSDPSMSARSVVAAGLAVLTTASLAACGSDDSTTALSQKNAAGVRAAMYAYFHALRADDVAAVCRLDLKPPSQLISAMGTTSCQAAYRKYWREWRESTGGPFASVVKRGEAEIAKRTIEISGDSATSFDPERQETEVFVYRDGRWFFVKESKNEAPTKELRRELREANENSEAMERAVESGRNAPPGTPSESVSSADASRDSV